MSHFLSSQFRQEKCQKKCKGLPSSQENHSIYPSDTEGGGDGVIATVITLDEQWWWACSHGWSIVFPRPPTKKYRHAAALKRLEPGDGFRHHVGVLRPLQVEDDVSYGQNQDH